MDEGLYLYKEFSFVLSSLGCLWHRWWTGGQAMTRPMRMSYSIAAKHGDVHDVSILNALPSRPHLPPSLLVGTLQEPLLITNPSIALTHRPPAHHPKTNPRSRDYTATMSSKYAALPDLVPPPNPNSSSPKLTRNPGQLPRHLRNARSNFRLIDGSWHNSSGHRRRLQLLWIFQQQHRRYPPAAQRRGEAVSTCGGGCEGCGF